MDYDKDFTCGVVAFDILLRAKGLRLAKDRLFHLLQSKPGLDVDIPSIIIGLSFKDISYQYHADFRRFVGKATFDSLLKFRDTLVSERQVDFLDKVLIILEDDDLASGCFLNGFNDDEVISYLSNGYVVLTILDAKIFSNGQKEGQHIIVITGMRNENFHNDFQINNEFYKSKDIVFKAMRKAKIPQFVAVRK